VSADYGAGPGSGAQAASPWDAFPAARQILTGPTEGYAAAYQRALDTARELGAPVLLCGRSGLPLLIALPGEAARVGGAS